VKYGLEALKANGIGGGEWIVAFNSGAKTVTLLTIQLIYTLMKLPNR
jgi:hypothetical protein